MKKILLLVALVFMGNKAYACDAFEEAKANAEKALNQAKAVLCGTANCYNDQNKRCKTFYHIHIGNVSTPEEDSSCLNKSGVFQYFVEQCKSNQRKGACLYLYNEDDYKFIHSGMSTPPRKPLCEKILCTKRDTIEPSKADSKSLEQETRSKYRTEHWAGIIFGRPEEEVNAENLNMKLSEKIGLALTMDLTSEERTVIQGIKTRCDEATDCDKDVTLSSYEKETLDSIFSDYDTTKSKLCKSQCSLYYIMLDNIFSQQKALDEIIATKDQICAQSPGDRTPATDPDQIQETSIEYPNEEGTSTSSSQDSGSSSDSKANTAGGASGSGGFLGISGFQGEAGGKEGKDVKGSTSGGSGSWVDDLKKALGITTTKKADPAKYNASSKKGGTGTKKSANKELAPQTDDIIALVQKIHTDEYGKGRVGVESGSSSSTEKPIGTEPPLYK